MGDFHRVIGKQITLLSAEELWQWRASYASATIDLGCGDGKYIATMAQKHPTTAFLAIEPVAETLAEASRKQRKLANLIYLRGVAAPDLQGFADRVWVILPWGSLMVAVGGGDRAILQAIARMLAPSGVLEVWLNRTVYEASEEYAARQGLATLPNPADADALARIYAEAGLRLREHAIDSSFPPTRWGRQLGRQKRLGVRFTCVVGN